MLSSRFLRVAITARQHGRSTRRTERVYDAWLRAVRATLAWVMARRPLTLVFSVVSSSRTGVLFMVDAEGILPDAGHRPAARDDRSGAGRVVRRHGRAPAAGRRDHRAGHERAVGDVVGRHDGGGRIRGSSRSTSSRSASASAAPTRSSRELRRAARRACPDITVFMQNPPAISDRRPRVEEPVSVHAAERRHRRRSIPRRAQLETRLRQIAAAQRRHERSADRESAGHGRHRPRARRPARRLGERDREHALRRVRLSGRCRRSTRRPTSTGS